MLFTPAVFVEKLVREMSATVTSDEVGFVSIQN